MSKTETLMKALIEAAEKDDKEAGMKAAVAIVVSFFDTQERQTAAMERVAAALEAQTKMLEKSLNPMLEAK